MFHRRAKPKCQQTYEIMLTEVKYVTVSIFLLHNKLPQIRNSPNMI